MRAVRKTRPRWVQLNRLARLIGGGECKPPLTGYILPRGSGIRFRVRLELARYHVTLGRRNYAIDCLERHTFQQPSYRSTHVRTLFLQEQCLIRFRQSTNFSFPLSHQLSCPFRYSGWSRGAYAFLMFGTFDPVYTTFE